MSVERRSDEELRAIYDEAYAEGYDPHAVPRIARLLPMCELTQSSVVLDAGSGNGVLAELVAPRVARVDGVDFSPAFVAVAERRRESAGLRNVAYHLADLDAFCAERPATYDAAFLLDVSEHVYDDTFVAMARAIRGALKPGRPLYLHTPNAEYVLERFRAWGVLPQIEGHVAVRSGPANEVLLRAAGFTDVSSQTLAHYLPFAARFHVLGGLPWVGRVFRARLFVTARG